MMYINYLVMENNKNLWWFERTYNQLIDRGKSRGLNKKMLVGYYEKHHILPKCMGGTNESGNLVLLTYREHVIAHILLTRIYSSPDLVRAANFMLSVDRIDDVTGVVISVPIKNSRIAEEIKLRSLELNNGMNSPSYGRKLSSEHKQKISEANRGKKSPETRRKMSESQKGKKASEETRKKLSEAHKGLKVHSEERKKFLSEKWKLNNPRKTMDMSGKNNPSSKKLKGPDGTIYESIKLAAKFNNIPYELLRKWVKNSPEKGFTLL